MAVVSRLALGAALLAGSASVLVAQGKQVTLEQAITRSALVQPRVVQAEGQVRNTGARIRSAKGAYLPNLNASANGADFFSENSRIDPSTGQIIQSGSTSRSVSGSLSSSVELFDGFRRSNELRAARASDEAALATLADARFQQALTTTGTFFDALSSRQLVRVREASVRRAEEQFKTAVAKLRAGSATRSDSLRAVVGAGNAQLQLLTAQAQLASNEANLGRLIGENERVEALDDSVFYRILPALDTVALRQEALANSPQVQAADASSRAADASVRSAKASYWPSLVLSGSSSINGTRSNDFRMLNQRQLSLGVSWQLFNRFTREQNIVQQTTAAEAARASAEDARRAVLADLTGRLAALEAARLRIDITQRSVEASREDLRVQQERYRLGVSTILDVLLTTESLDQAEVDAVSARFDYLRAKATIEALIGRAL